jgi:hypothetical protein
VEWIVGALVVLGFIAITVRFIPRDDAGRARLPTIVDNSIGMWALRRMTGRPLWERPDGIGPRTGTNVGGSDGASGAARRGLARPARGASTRYAASPSRLQALGIRPAGLARGSTSTRRRPMATPTRLPVASVNRGREEHGAGSLVVLRRVVAIIAIIAIAAVAIWVAFLPHGPGGPRGEVLAATSQPGGIANPPATASPSTPAAPSASSRAGSPKPTRSPKPTVAAATPRPTPAPTPRVTPRPTVRPTPTPAPTPTPSVQPSTTPSSASSIAPVASPS